MTLLGETDAIFQSGGGPVALVRRSFFKMTGSGNDFVFFDNRGARHEALLDPAIIGAICDRRSGIGADGIVFIDEDPAHAFGMRYYNRDGSLAEMCGNAALCSARLAREIGITHDESFSFLTPSGPVTARIVDGTPEIDMTAVTELVEDAQPSLEDGERRIGYARVGVPHLVVRCNRIDDVDVDTRGRALRHHPSMPRGANVNFVGRAGDRGWTMRTFERGVEAETLACGTGTVAVVALLNAWGEVSSGVTLMTRSGRHVYADIGRDGRAPVLRGEGRIVFTGTIDDLPFGSR